MLKKFALYSGVFILFLVSSGSHQVALGQDPYSSMKKPVSDRSHPLPVGQAVQNDLVSIPQALSGVGDWSKIAYQSYMSGNWEIYLTDGNGNNLTNLTNHPAVDFGPRLARGAEKVVFTSNRDGNDEIYTSLSSGGGLSRLTFAQADDYSPDWSPQGDRIVFVSERDGNPEIYVMNADGSGQTRLTYDPAPDTSPAWSPNGQRIAWARYTDNIYGDIMLMNPAGGEQVQQLTHKPFLGAVAWGPDSTKLIADFDVDWDYWNEIVLVDFANGVSTLLDAGQNLVDLWVGGYSPDGKWVIFSRIEYVVYGNQLLIDNTFVDMKKMEYPDTYARIPGVGFEMDPDWETADIFAPASQVVALPPYSRQNGVRVAWTGSDSGPGGITYYEVQYRIGKQGDWMGWYRSDPLALSGIFSFGIPGDQVYFRSRAYDAAGNIEVWPSNPDGDASTFIYSWRVDGSVTDNRGVPVPKPQIQVSPAPINLLTYKMTNNYSTWLGSASPVAFQATQDGYGAFPPADLALNSDLRQDFYLPPQVDFLVNGGFEDQLAGWQITGTSSLTSASELAHTGQFGLKLNEPCPAPCISGFQPSLNYSQADMTSLQDGTIVVIYGTGSGQTVQMAVISLPPGGTWSNPEIIGTFPFSSSGNRPVIDVDKQDNLHAVWMGGDGLYYNHKPSNESWSSQQFIGAGVYPDLGVDQLGGVHVIYNLGSDVSYLERLPDGTWQAPVRLSSGYRQPAIAVGPDNTVYFLWQVTNEGIYFRSKFPGGALAPAERLFSGTGYSHYPQRITSGPAGDLHAFWVWGHAGYYSFRPLGEDWQPAVQLPNAYGPADLAVDSRGVLHMLGYSVSPVLTGYHQTRSPTTGWSEQARFFPEYTESVLTIDPQDRLHLLIRSSSLTQWNYYTSRLASQARTISASQVLTIPSDAHEPTLSFFYTLNNLLPSGKTFFQVSIKDGKNSTTVFTTSANCFWTQAWADLTPWVGKTITINLSLFQASGEPEALLSIDDVSLGSWPSPRITKVTPAKLGYDWTGEVITIEGMNFSPGATVFLNDKQLIDLLWINQSTIQVTLPAGILPGFYDLWVVNPGPYLTVLTHALVFGNTFYLPIIHR